MTKKKVAAVEQPETINQEPKLTLDTLAWAARIIEAASKRGAFHANELSNVGRVYDELAAYVEHYRPAQKPSSSSEQESEEELEGSEKED